MKLELTPEVQADLLAQARESGLSLEDFAARVLSEKSGEAFHLARKQADERPIWEVITHLVKAVPDGVFDRLPRDGASHIDHYIYGLPKSRKSFQFQSHSPKEFADILDDPGYDA